MTGIRLNRETCRSLLKLKVGDAIPSDDYEEILRLCSKHGEYRTVYYH